MKNIYYSVWGDAMVNIAKNTKHKKDWKLFSMIYMSILNSLNFWVVSLLFADIFDVKMTLVKTTVFPGETLNSFASFFIQFWLPFILINYVLIFYKGRYKRLIQSYPEKKGRLLAIYLLGSIGLCFAYVISYLYIG